MSSMKFSQQLSSSDINKQNHPHSESSYLHTQNPNIRTLSLTDEDRNLMFRKRQWTEKEDQMLIKVINEHGAKRWAFIAQFIPNRIGKQCRQRWHNHLNPNINKTEWTPQQQWMLYLLFLLHGGKWAKMTAFLTLRTDNSIKNHWNSIMKKKVPALQQKLSQILNNESFNYVGCSVQEKSLLEKVKSKKGNQQNDLFFSNCEFRTRSLQQLQSLEEEINEKEESQINNSQQLNLIRKTSQFQVNIDGLLPETSEYIPLRQIKMNEPQFRIFMPYPGNSQIVEQISISKEQSFSLPLLSKSHSVNQNYPILNFYKKASSDFQIYGSNFKKRSNSSFNDKNGFCNSPKLKARYSQIYASQSEVELNEIMEEKSLFDFIVQEDNENEIKMRRRLSKNISIISPTKFMEKSNSV